MVLDMFPLGMIVKLRALEKRTTLRMFDVRCVSHWDNIRWCYDGI